MINETVITALVSVLLGIFGKEFWDFWKNRDIIKGQIDCKEKIAQLEKKLLEEESERKQTTVAVSMLLNIFEVEYGTESKYQSTIDQVRTYLKLIDIK